MSERVQHLPHPLTKEEVDAATAALDSIVYSAKMGGNVPEDARLLESIARYLVRQEVPPAVDQNCASREVVDRLLHTLHAHLDSFVDYAAKHPEVLTDAHANALARLSCRVDSLGPIVMECDSISEAIRLVAQGRKDEAQAVWRKPTKGVYQSSSQKKAA